MKKNKFQNLINFILKNGLIITAIIVGIIGILSIFITAYFNTTFANQEEKTYFKYSFGIVETLISIFIILFITLLYKTILRKIPSKILLILLLICCLTVFIFWVKVLQLKPEVDQKMIHDMAIRLYNDGISGFTGSLGIYLILYPYQFGLTFFVAIIYKIFGENYMYILFINCICSIINMFILFRISKLLFKDENVQKLLTIFLGGFALYWMFFNVHFYGNIIGLTLSLMAVCFVIYYFENKKLFNLFLSGILISLAILIKTNYNIFLCGILLILMLKVIESWKLKTLLIIPIFLIGYFSINFGYSELLKYIDCELHDGVPMIAFIYMGMDEPNNMSPGWYTNITTELFSNNNYDSEVTSKLAIDLIKKRVNYFMQNPNEFANYYSQKIGSTWLNPTFQTIWCSLPGQRYIWDPDYAHYLSYHPTIMSMLSGKIYKFEEHFFNIYQILVFTFASIGIFKNAKDLDLKKAFLPIIFAGGFVFHIFWETKSIYVIQYYFLLLPFAAFGLNYCINKLSFIFINRKNKI